MRQHISLYLSGHNSSSQTTAPHCSAEQDLCVFILVFARLRLCYMFPWARHPEQCCLFSPIEFPLSDSFYLSLHGQHTGTSHTVWNGWSYGVSHCLFGDWNGNGAVIALRFLPIPHSSVDFFNFLSIKYALGFRLNNEWGTVEKCCRHPEGNLPGSQRQGTSTHRCMSPSHRFSPQRPASPQTTSQRGKHLQGDTHVPALAAQPFQHS